jgi:magnesium transporter
MLHILPKGDNKTGELGVVATRALWLDLLNPTSAEVTNVEETVGATLPSLGALSEIETSSRLRNSGGGCSPDTKEDTSVDSGSRRSCGSRFGGR